MEWLFELLDGVYSQLDQDDADFIKAYQTSIFKTLVNYFKHDMDLSLDNTLFYSLNSFTSYNQMVIPEWITTIVENPTIPYKLPSGIKEITAYGSPSVFSITVTLPYDIGDKAEIISVSDNDNYSIDKSKILGTGTANIEYKTYVCDPLIMDNKATNPAITKLIITHSAENAIKYKSNGIITTDGYLYDPHSYFDKLQQGTRFEIGETEFIFNKTEDPHTAIMDMPIPDPNRDVLYSHLGFQYAFDCQYESIPVIDLMDQNKDYIIRNGKIGFASLPSDRMIAPMCESQNSNLYEKFGAYLGLSKDTLPDVIRGYWAERFEPEAGLLFALSTIFGQPTTLPNIGRLKIKKNDVNIINQRPSKTGKIKAHKHLVCDEDYFQFADKYILFEKGGFARIIKYISRNEVLIDSDFLKQGDEIVFSIVDVALNNKILATDEYGNEKEFDIFGVPFFPENEIVPLWRRLVSGIALRDKTSDPNYLRNQNTFEILYDIPIKSKYIIKAIQSDFFLADSTNILSIKDTVNAY